ncbi:MAG: hypothetical protein RB292_04930 [Patescibacteria group bacterium]|jgi:hypothetical protein|nr:hypothetical protein [Patescibacteria group bacterium]
MEETTVAVANTLPTGQIVALINQRGHRWGYFVPSTDAVIVIGYSGTFPGAMFRPAPPKVSRTKEKGYDELPRAVYSDGECCNCHAYPNPETRQMIGGRMRTVVVCKKCGKVMRPPL